MDRILSFSAMFDQGNRAFSGGATCTVRRSTDNSAVHTENTAFDAPSQLVTINPGEVLTVVLSLGKVMKGTTGVSGAATTTFTASLIPPAEVPMPAAGGLLAPGLLSLAALRRRKAA